jgi:hypothetical protein
MKRNNAYHITHLIPESRLEAPQHLRATLKTSSGTILFSILMILGISYFVHGLVFGRTYDPVQSALSRLSEKVK